MKKETAFALRMWKNMSSNDYDSIYQTSKIERASITVLSYLKPGAVNEQLLNINSSLKEFGIIPEGKAAWFEDPAYEHAPNQYRIVFRDTYNIVYTEADLVKFLCLLPETIWIKSLEIERKS